MGWLSDDIKRLRSLIAAAANAEKIGISHKRIRFEFPGSVVFKTWIIIHRPGLCPDTKTPILIDNGTEKMLEEIYQLYPDATCTVCRLAYGLDLWVSDGKLVLWEHKMAIDAATIPEDKL